MNDKQLQEHFKSVEEFVESWPAVKRLREDINKLSGDLAKLKTENARLASRNAELKRDGFAALYGAKRLNYDEARGVLPPHCPKCARQMNIKTNTHTGQKFWGCNWPKCWGARDWPDATRDRGRLIVEEAHPLIGGPGDGRRIPVAEGIDTLHLPIPQQFSGRIQDPPPTFGIAEARYVKMYFPCGTWAWVYDGLTRGEVEALLLAGYGVTP